MSIIADVLNNANKVTHSKYKTHFMAVLCLMAVGNGKVEAKELNLLQQLVFTLPEFRDLSKKELTEMTKKAMEKINTYKSPLMATLYFKEILDEAAKKKCFVLALEMALASGLADSRELPLLEKLQKEMELNNEFVTQAAQAFGAKYP